MLAFLKKYKILLSFIFMTMCLTLTTTWVVEKLNIPTLFTRGLTVLVYAPFIGAILWKLIGDIWALFKKQKPDILSCLYYLFALYYAGLCVWRFLSGMEIKENLYYTLVLVGSVAIFSQLQKGRLSVEKGEITHNLTAIAIYLVAYRLLYAFIFADFFQKQPINTNLVTGSLGLLLPLLLISLCDKNGDKQQHKMAAIAVFGSLIVIVTTGARAIFLLSILSVVVVVLCNLINWKGLVRVGAVLIAVACTVSMLAAINYGSVRYALYRETGLNVSSLFGTTQELPAPPEDDIVENEIQNQAQDQIKQSDNMRGDLVEWGIAEIKKNPVFGTGDVLFRYMITAERGFMQSSHNFLIETIICYGIIGLVLIAALFLWMLWKTGLLHIKNWRKWRNAVGALLVVIYYFAFGFVQPTVYAPMICSLFVILLAGFGVQSADAAEKSGSDHGK